MSFSQTIFLTGFPGFIAERLVAQLSRSDVMFYMLVQPQFVEKAMASIEQISARTNVPVENFALVEGDITSDGLGMAAEDLESLRRETTDVFHLAAVYDLAVERDLAFSVNLKGTQNVNEFCKSLPHLQRYNYISTCYVAGRRTGTILETELDHEAGFRNFYEETKYLAEKEVEALKLTLPVTIFRPSVVVGDSETGETAKYDGIYYLIKYLLKAPNLLRIVNVGNRDVTLNLVPVDFVVDAIASLSRDPAAVGKTIAVADPQPLTTAELFDVLSREMTGKGSFYTPPTAVVQSSLKMSISPTLTGLPHSGVPYFFVSQEYDTSVADALLGPRGIRCPRFDEYAGNLVRFVRSHPDL